jgi:YbgC/YbaW family acyl-CoA thioester hydrolase
MAKDDYNCVHRLRVRWAEVDMQKVVFNGHYLTYIDTAFADYLRAIDLPYPDGYVDKYANDIFLRKAAVEYLGSAHYEDELAVHCRVSKLGRSSITFLFEIWREMPDASPAPLITAELVYVNAEPKTMKAAPLPEDLRSRVRRYERTAPAEA